MAYRRLALDGGTIEYIVDGPEDARDLLVFHAGTPSAAVHWPPLIRAAAAAGLRTMKYSRAGYGASTRREGRSVADEVAITGALADRLGYDRFHPGVFDPLRIGRSVRAVRLRLGLRQVGAAIRAGVSRSCVSKSDEMGPDLDAVAAARGV